MNDRGEGSILGRLAYAAGYALGRADTLIEGDDAPDTESMAPPSPYPNTPPNDRQEDYGGDYAAAEEAAYNAAARAAARSYGEAPEVEPAENGASAAIALGTVAAGWLLGRLIRPHPVNWPRAILAGVAGTALAELTESLLHPDPERPTPFPPRIDDIPRYAAGVATAAAYGAQIYPRLPGSGLTRGLIFGTVEAVVADRGGALGMLQSVAPQLRLPLGSLASYALPQRSTVASLAFGLGLGLYSGKGKRR